MPRAMYRYTKAVLKKVSFDIQLFAAELRKAKLRLLPNELEELRIWSHGLKDTHSSRLVCPGFKPD